METDCSHTQTRLPPTPERPQGSRTRRCMHVGSTRRDWTSWEARTLSWGDERHGQASIGGSSCGGCPLATDCVNTHPSGRSGRCMHMKLPRNKTCRGSRAESCHPVIKSSTHHHCRNERHSIVAQLLCRELHIWESSSRSSGAP